MAGKGTAGKRTNSFACSPSCSMACSPLVRRYNAQCRVPEASHNARQNNARQTRLAQSIRRILPKVSCSRC